MNMTLRDRLIEKAFDRILIGVLVGMATLLANMYMERYKLTEIQRAHESASFVDAAASSWTAIDEYEWQLESLDSLLRHEWILAKLGNKADADVATNISSQREAIAISLKTVQSTLRKNRHVLGEPMNLHFHRYIGLLNMRADARISSREDASDFIQENARQVADELSTILGEMRFSTSSARDFAMRRARQPI